MPVTGATTHVLRKDNKRARITYQLSQDHNISFWSKHQGKTNIPKQLPTPPSRYRSHMCPAGLALLHPATPKLLQYATRGCPVQSGLPWTQEQMQAAIDRRPHKSALSPDAINQLQQEVKEKVAMGQARLVNCNDIKDDPPPQLKISPISIFWIYWYCQEVLYFTNSCINLLLCTYDPESVLLVVETGGILLPG